MSSTSAADVDEILRVGCDSDAIDSSMPTAIPNSPVDAAPTQISLFERCRRLILPLAMQNTRARDTKVDGAIEPKRLEQQVMTLMTDEYCANSLNMAKEIEEQMAIKKTGNVEDTGWNAESIVGVKRPREEDDAVEPLGPSRVPLNWDGSEVAMGDMPLPRAPKAMIENKQNQVLGKFMSMVLPSDNNVSVTPARIENDTPP